jgi:hypothetical protein
LELHHSVSDLILINFMCHMTLLSNPLELFMLTLDMLDMDITLYNFDVFLELHHSVSDLNPDQFDVSHGPLEQPH